MHLSCAQCAAPIAIAEVHAFVRGQPLCCAACAAGFAPPALPEPQEALSKAKAHLQSLGAAVRAALAAANEAESSPAPNVRFVGGRRAYLANALIDSAAESLAESRRNTINQHLWEIDKGSRELVTHIMLLEESGFDVASHSAPLVQRYGSLTGRDVGIAEHLFEMHEYLRWLHSVVEALMEGVEPPQSSVKKAAAPETRPPVSANKCPRCCSPLDPETGGHTSLGFVCELCLSEYEAIAIARQNNNPKLKIPVGSTLLNVASVAGGLLFTGFAIDFGGEVKVARSEAELKATRDANERALARRRQAAFIRRNDQHRGPYDQDEIEALLAAGYVKATDEFFIEGMDAWRPMSAFSPDLLEGTGEWKHLQRRRSLKKDAQ